MKANLFYIAFAVLMIIGVISSNTLLVVFSFISLIIALLIMKFENSNKAISFEEESIQLFNKHHLSDYIIGKDLLSSIAIDEENNKIVLLTRENDNEILKEKIIGFDDVFEVKLIEDEITVTSTSKTSALGGALVGAAIGGSAGMIIGGLSGSQQSDKEVRKISLEIVVNDLSEPIHNVYFLNEQNFMSRFEQKYKESYALANKWFKKLSVIIKRNEYKNMS